MVRGSLILGGAGSPKQCGSSHYTVYFSSSKLVLIKESSCLLCMVLIPGVNEGGLPHPSILACLAFFLHQTLKKYQTLELNQQTAVKARMEKIPCSSTRAEALPVKQKEGGKQRQTAQH